MKIQDILEKEEKSRENKDMHLTPSPGNLGQFITTSQAAKILNVSPSRVRQFIQDNKLSSHSPIKGQRDNFLKTSEVRAFGNKKRERTGRPDEGKGTSRKDDNDKSKDDE